MRKPNGVAVGASRYALHRAYSREGLRTEALVGMAVLATLLVTLPIRGHAQEKFPSRSIELVVPTPPGGGVDISGRIIAEMIEPILGVKVLVSNKPGANGTIGLGYVAAAKPEGYVLGMAYGAPLTIGPHTMKLAYGPDDFTPITQLTGGTALIFCVKPEFPASNGREFIEHLKQNPDKYSYGNDGVGAMVQLAGERLFQPLAVRMRPIPLSGAGETLKLFLGGHIDIYGGSIPPIAAFVKEGRAKCLLSTSNARSPMMPNADTAADLGMADRATELWRGVVGPKGLPADRLKVLETAMRNGAQMEKFRTYVVGSSEKVVANTPEEFRAMYMAEYRDFAKVVQGLSLPK
jgi:tripartite-type tricarboxylate transporter receptor subunit TctC